jgi:hypothetical protein
MSKISLDPVLLISRAGRHIIEKTGLIIRLLIYSVPETAEASS